MILENNSKMANLPLETPQDSPPSYDHATHGVKATADSLHVQNPKVPVIEPSPLGSPSPSMPQTAVYRYVNPVTSEHITSLLPPDHPEMICLQAGEHIRETKFGIVGIIAAIIWFPLGIGLCLLDRRVKCTRCGKLLDNGMCD